MRRLFFGKQAAALICANDAALRLLHSTTALRGDSHKASAAKSEAAASSEALSVPVALEATLPPSLMLPPTPEGALVPSCTTAVDADAANGLSGQGSYEKVGNIIIITCVDYPFKYGWEVCRMLRDLQLEFRGQTVFFPDIPAVRLRLWRVRHVVSIEIINLSVLKRRLGIPEHITFNDLLLSLPHQQQSYNNGSGAAARNEFMRSKARWNSFRRARLTDILKRDAVELKLLEEKRKLMSMKPAAAPPK